MRFLSVIVAALIVIGFGRMMDAPAAVNSPVCAEGSCTLPIENAAECATCPEVEISKKAYPEWLLEHKKTCSICSRLSCPENPSYDGRRAPVRKVVGVVAKVPGKVAKAGAVVVKAPVKAVRAVRQARPARRILGRVFCRRRR